MNKAIQYFSIISPLFLFSLQSNASDEWRFETQLTSYSMSKLVPIKSLADDSWAGKYQATDNIFTTSRADIAIGWGHWLIGLSNRFDYFGHFSEDTGRYFYLDKNKIAPPDKQALDIYLGVEHAVSHGAFVQYDNRWNNINYALRLNYWHSENVLSGSVDGHINTNTGQDFTGQLNFDYNYDEDTLFDRLTPNNVQGSGYSLDIDIAWTINQHLALSLRMKDVAHRIDWDQVYHTKAALDRTQDKSASAPSLSGIEDNQNYKQSYKQQTYLQIGYELEVGRVFGGTDYINSEHHYYLGFERTLFSDTIEANIAFYPDSKSIKLGLAHQSIGINLGLNKISLSDTNSLMLEVYFKY